MSKLYTIGKIQDVAEIRSLIHRLEVMLADLERDLNKFSIQVPSGQIGGTYKAPTIVGLRETGGPTLLTMGAVADGQKLARSGTTIIGVP